MTLGRYHEITRMDGYKFMITNDDTQRVLCRAENGAELTKKWVPVFGRYTLEYSSLTDDNTIEYHIRCGMTVNDHIQKALCNSKTIGVREFDIRDITGETLLLTTYKEHFNPGKYGLYPVVSRRVCFDKIILKTDKPPVEGEMV